MPLLLSPRDPPHPLSPSTPASAPPDTGQPALAAASVFRSMLGFAFPLFGQQMYDKLGLGGGNSLLAGLAIVLGIPFPVFLWFYGEQMRAKSSLAR